MLHAARRPGAANADAETGKVGGARRADDVLDTVVAGVGTPGPQPDAPHRQRHLVINDYQIRRPAAETRQQVAHRFARQVHIGARLGQRHRLPVAIPLPQGRSAPPVVDRNAPALRQQVNALKPHIMPRPPVARPRIAQSDNQTPATGAFGLLLWRRHKRCVP